MSALHRQQQKKSSDWIETTRERGGRRPALQTLNSSIDLFSLTLPRASISGLTPANFTSAVLSTHRPHLESLSVTHIHQINPWTNKWLKRWISKRLALMGSGARYCVQCTYGHEQHLRSLPRMLLMYNRGTYPSWHVPAVQAWIRNQITLSHWRPALWSVVYYTNWSPSVHTSQAYTGCLESHRTPRLFARTLLMLS